MAGKPEKGFKIEYAKSGRAGCKGCGEKILQDGLRLGKMVPSPHFDGFVPLWHHVPCYFRKKKCECDVADIEGFMDIKFDDQKLIKELISGTTKVVVPVKTKGKGKAGGGGAAGGGAKSEYEVGDYAVEVAKSGRAKCRECEQPIAAGALRCGLVEQMDRPPFLPSPKWHHLKCVDVSSTGVRDVKDITGFDLLSKDDQDIMRAKFSGAGSKKRPNEDSSSSAKKVKQEKPTVVEDDSDDDVSLLALPLKREEDKKKEKEPEATSTSSAGKVDEMSAAEEKAMKTHSDKLFNIRTKLKQVKTPSLREMLNFNDVTSSGGEVTIQVCVVCVRVRCQKVLLNLLHDLRCIKHQEVSMYVYICIYISYRGPAVAAARARTG